MLTSHFEKHCLYNEVEVINKTLSTATERQRQMYLNSTVKDNSALNLEVDDHIIGFSPIHLAAIGGDINLMSVLIRFGGNVNHVGNMMGTPLHVSMLCNNYAVFNLLVNKGADVNGTVNFHENGNAFHILFMLGAKKFGKEYTKKWIEILYKIGCDVNHQDSNGNIALALCPPACMQEFLNCEADINIRNLAGQIPLRKLDVSLDIVSELWSIECYIAVLYYVMKLNALEKYVAEENEEICQKILILIEVVQENGDDFGLKIINKQEISFQLECLKLKCTYVSSQVSLFELLDYPAYKSARFSSHPLYKQIFDLKNLQNQFSAYYWFLARMHKKTMIRKLRLEPAKKTLYKLFDKLIPAECIDYVLDYLNNSDLQFLNE